MFNILAKLKDSLTNSFNIHDNYSIDKYYFDFMGEFFLTNSKFFLSKEKIIYAYNNNEYIFAKEVDHLTEDYLKENILPFAEYAMDNVIKTDSNHMSSIITLFLSSNSVDSNLCTLAKKFKRRKSYMFGLKGYANTRLILFDKSNNELYYNSDSKEVIKFYKEVVK
ncbi:MAG: hypothetical protein ACRDA3_11070 [Peptostreptococcaceae bacterium]